MKGPLRWGFRVLRSISMISSYGAPSSARRFSLNELAADAMPDRPVACHHTIGYRPRRNPPRVSSLHVSPSHQLQRPQIRTRMGTYEHFTLRTTERCVPHDTVVNVISSTASPSAAKRKCLQRCNGRITLLQPKCETFAPTGTEKTSVGQARATIDSIQATLRLNSILGRRRLETLQANTKRRLPKHIIDRNSYRRMCTMISATCRARSPTRKALPPTTKTQ